MDLVENLLSTGKERYLNLVKKLREALSELI